MKERPIAARADTQRSAICAQTNRSRALKTPRRLYRCSQRTTFIAPGATTLPELLRQIPGVHVAQVGQRRLGARNDVVVAGGVRFGREGTLARDLHGRRGTDTYVGTPTSVRGRDATVSTFPMIEGRVSDLDLMATTGASRGAL